MPKEGKRLKLIKIHEAGPWSWLKAYFICPRTTDMRCSGCMERRSRGERKKWGGKKKKNRKENLTQIRNCTETAIGQQY